ncbi:phosphate ABC transporter substrate-binding protein [Amphibacillus indicireducens]|uniref:Phosphate-binding protein n=1 Tax=Amphibacillus indicireducens TaxID=1076330 RepID=A0ABP7VV85_9BACI
MKMKKFILLLLVSLFAAAVLVGCAGDDTEDAGNDSPAEEEVESNDDAGEDDSAEEASATLEGTITMAGSTSVQPLSEVLAGVFMEEHTGVRLEVSGGGSGSGITAAQENTADFGAVSREVREDETGIHTYTIAIDGIGIIVHPDNEVSDITVEDVQKIFAGEITNWSEVGGADENIVVVSREEGSGTRGAFDDIVLGDAALVDTALIQNSSGSVRESVGSEANAIGYVSTGSLNEDVKALSVGGVEPTPENIIAGDYSVARPFNYVANKGESLSELAQAYLDFVLSEEGQAIVEEQGFVRVN